MARTKEISMDYSEHCEKQLCVYCNRYVPLWEPKYCCNGDMCGCQGMPIDPPVCDLCSAEHSHGFKHHQQLCRKYEIIINILLKTADPRVIEYLEKYHIALNRNKQVSGLMWTSRAGAKDEFAKLVLEITHGAK